MTKQKVLAAITALIVSLGLLGLFFGNLANSSDPVRVACVGDSITESSGYPHELDKIIGVNYEVGNFGVGGSTVSLNSGKPYMSQTAFQDAKARHPDIVVIMLGTNDAAMSTYQHIDNFVADYKKLIDEFQSLPSKPEVWLVKPPPIFSDTLGPIDTNLNQGVIPLIEQVAEEMGLPVIDVHAALANSPQFFYDGVHPDSQGAKIIADEVNKAIISNGT